MKQITPANDEATRKDLVNFILYKAGHLIDEETEHRFIAYLEKQKEQNVEPFSCGHENGESEKPKQEQPKMDLEKEIQKYFQGYWPGMETSEQCNTDMHFTPPAIMRLAEYFYKLGLNARKEESK